MNMKNKEIPILFSTEMVKAILEGRKTQTRRIVKPQPNKSVTDIISLSNYFVSAYPNRMAFKPFEFSIKSKYQKGDILWVRETYYRYGKWVKNGISKLGNQKWKFISDKQFNEVRYFDNPPVKIQKNKDMVTGWYKRNSIFMPKEACRIWLKITNVDVERVQDIDESDSLDEGINSFTKDNIGFKFGLNRWHWSYQTGFPFMCSSAKLAYSNLWEKINGKESWDNNPWVWKIEFEIYDKK